MRDPIPLCFAIVAAFVLVGLFGDRSKCPEDFDAKAAAYKRAAQHDLVRKGLAEWRFDPVTGEARLVRLTEARAGGAK